MCGLFGVIFTNPANSPPAPVVQKLFTALAVLSADRGTDAVGMAHVATDGRGWVYKDGNSAYEVVRRVVWNNCLAAVNQETLALLGHTRRASQGSKITANAHPFQFVTDHGTLFGAHNGTVSNDVMFGPEKYYECDSANVLHGLSVRPEAGWLDMLSDLTGSFALVWARNGKVYAARNWGSPLWLAEAPSLQAKVYASTQHILLAGAALAGVSIQGAREIVQGDLYTFDRDNVSLTRFEAMANYQNAASTPQLYTMNDDKPMKRWCEHCHHMSWSSFRRLIHGRVVCDDCIMSVTEAGALAAALRSLEHGEPEWCNIHGMEKRVCAVCWNDHTTSTDVKNIIAKYTNETDSRQELIIGAAIGELASFSAGFQTFHG